MKPIVDLQLKSKRVLLLDEFLLQTEMDYFHNSMDEPIKPLMTVASGTKVSSILGVLENVLPMVDRMIVASAMTNTFLNSMGINVGASKVEEKLFADAKRFVDATEKKGNKLYLPVDFVVVDRFASRYRY
jgi:phosphoglycerate kinase